MQARESEADFGKQIEYEQRFVDRAYANLDESRRQYRTSQRAVEAQGAWGTPQARTERDALAAHYGDQAARLESIEDRLVFGRLDTATDVPIYIGRAGLRDDNGSRLLVDWRAPAAQPFYQATAVEPRGVIRRRHISTHLRRVRGLEDEVLDTESARGSGLQFQGEGALISALSEARDGRMTDIVSTIQSEQDAVIRADDRGLLIVQGGPGTGKTAVALHRAAYLLYTHRERLERAGVLIVGPSPIFLRYIEQVLPSLGETGVVSLTMGELLPGISTTLLDSIPVRDAKGTLAWLPVLRQSVKNLQKVPEEDESLKIGGRVAVLTKAMVISARTRARRSGKPHNEAREIFALELVEGLTTQLAGPDPDPDTIRWWMEEVRASRAARRSINRCWMPTDATELLARLYSRPGLLLEVGRALSPEQRELVRRPKDSPLTVSDIPLLDELQELLGDSPLLGAAPQADSGGISEDEIRRAQEAIDGQQLGGGIVSAEMLAQQTLGARDWKPLAERARRDRSWTYGHVVVDEAQDLTPMEWHALLRRCPSQSFTAVGDLDQRRGMDRPESWTDILGPATRALADERSLTISYRTPRSVTELSQSVQAALGFPVRFPLTSARDVNDALADTVVTAEQDLRAAVMEAAAEEARLLDMEYGKDAGRIGVLLSQSRAIKWGADGAGRSAFSQRISYLSVVAAKGLEFDTTIIVEPAEVLADGPGDLFVAMTRCTRRLHSIHRSPLPAVWDQALEARASWTEPPSE